MKKVFRWIGKLLVGILLIGLTAALIFWGKNQLYIGGTDKNNVVYLADNKRDITNVKNDADLFDPDFYTNKVFLLGENHGSADVQLVDKMLLIHLNKKVGLRYYVAEMDSIRANQLNRFLTNPHKDTLLLKQVVRDISRRIPQQSSRGLFEKWSEIYDYNTSLADSLSITVIGVDKSLEDTTRTVGRDSAMHLNFRQAIASRNLENEKFYGLFGYTHVLQDNLTKGNPTPFAARIKQSSLPFAAAIKSIVCYNVDSEIYLPPIGQFPTPPDEKTGLLNADGPITMVKGISELKEVTSDHTITLFNLERPNSPYRTSQKLAGVKVNFFGEDVLPRNDSQATTDFFQYVVLSRGSEALTKIE